VSAGDGASGRPASPPPDGLRIVASADGRGDVWVSAPFGGRIEPPPPWLPDDEPPTPAPTGRGGPVPAFAPVPAPPPFRQPNGPRRRDPAVPAGPKPVVTADPAADRVDPPATGSSAPGTAPPTTARPTTAPGAEGSPAPRAAGTVNLALDPDQLARLLELLERPVAVPGPLAAAGTLPAPPAPADEWQEALRRARQEAEEARAVAIEMHRRLVNATVEQERERYRLDGVPPELLDLAEPLLRAGAGDQVDAGAVARRMLDFVRDRYGVDAGQPPADVDRLLARWEALGGPDGG